MIYDKSAHWNKFTFVPEAHQNFLITFTTACLSVDKDAVMVARYINLQGTHDVLHKHRLYTGIFMCRICRELIFAIRYFLFAIPIRYSLFVIIRSYHFGVFYWYCIRAHMLTN